MSATILPESARAFVDYYASLLVLQYLNLTKAKGTIGVVVGPAVLPQTSIKTVAFSATPTSGTYTITYNALYTTSALAYNATAAQVQTALQALPGLSAVTVAGSASTLFTITFTGVAPPAAAITVTTTGLMAGAVTVTATVTVTDVTLPLAVQSAFNLTGPNTAVGVQLDTLGKYAGVTRTGYGFQGSTVTLSDTDFLTLIQLTILKNNAGSSLATIQALLKQFFPGEILVFDYQNMQMSYLISTSVGSQSLVQLFVTEKILPKPMGVQLGTTIYAGSITNFFGFRTYVTPAFNSSPFNSYSSYQTNEPWLSYANAITV